MVVRFVDSHVHLVADGRQNPGTPGPYTEALRGACSLPRYVDAVIAVTHNERDRVVIPAAAVSAYRGSTRADGSRCPVALRGVEVEMHGVRLSDGRRGTQHGQRILADDGTLDAPGLNHPEWQSHHSTPVDIAEYERHPYVQVMNGSRWHSANVDELLLAYATGRFPGATGESDAHPHALSASPRYMVANPAIPLTGIMSDTADVATAVRESFNNGRTFMTVARDVRSGQLPPRIDALRLGDHGLEANVMRAHDGVFSLERVRSAAASLPLSVRLSQLPSDAVVEIIHNGRVVNGAQRPNADGTFAYSAAIPLDTVQQTRGAPDFRLHGNRYTYDSAGGFVAVVVRRGGRVILASSAIAYTRSS